jgi:glyceraldehyde 3-phosphate dehydrogenase
MKRRIAINGFGRIGRLFFRQAFGHPDLEIIAVNDLGDLENLAYLLRYDTVYRTYARSVSVDAVSHALIVDGASVAVLQEKDPAKLPWAKMDIDLVVECTGLFESFEGSSAHLRAGAKRVVLSAPAKDADGELGKTVLLGMNEDQMDVCPVTSNGSCTTNAAAPVVAILSENPGIESAILSTIHGYTATQSLVDGPVRGGHDFRRGRAAAQNIVPSTTGAALTVGRVVPSLAGKFDGIAFRVPTIAGSLADITCVTKRPVTKEEINAIFREAVLDPRWKDTVKVLDDQVVSSDILGEPYGAVIDLSFTTVVHGTLVKVLSWYDNEYGYTATLFRHVLRALQC